MDIEICPCGKVADFVRKTQFVGDHFFCAECARQEEEFLVDDSYKIWCRLFNKPYKIYSDNIEESALEQFHSAMRLDWVVQGALMPDAHTGYSLPIGAVIATKGKIVPSWVGYDIGCGMCAIPTSFDAGKVIDHSDEIFAGIYDNVPTGYSNRKDRVFINFNNVMTSDMRKIYDDKNGDYAIGTLGSGNHFIEIGKDEDNRVWVVVHSGSRGVGHGCASHYMRIASGDGKAREGHLALDVESDDGQNYIMDLLFCQEYALINRKHIVKSVIKVLSSYMDGDGDWDNLINRNHNHAEYKNGLWIHRKGATHADKGMSGVIPGNMRDGSFIVVGKGNQESLCSSSHGAGRVMGRKKAKNTVSMDDFIDSMSGIKAKVAESTKDESPMAYKNIFEVMDMQKDLVEVSHHIRPIINIKA